MINLSGGISDPRIGYGTGDIFWSVLIAFPKLLGSYFLGFSSTYIQVSNGGKKEKSDFPVSKFWEMTWPDTLWFYVCLSWRCTLYF